MRAALYLSAGTVVVDDVPDPTIVDPTDAVVRVVRACVCGSDLWAYRDTFARPERSRLGHEFIGIVEAIGAEVRDVAVGDFVVVPFFAADGTCPACRAGLPSSCPHYAGFGGKGMDGGQGEAARVPFADATLVAVPGGVEGADEGRLASLLSLTDVMATGLHGANMALTREGGTVVVVGDGAVGLCAVLGASTVIGAERVVLLSTHQDRAALGRRFGATDVVAARGEEAKEAVMELTGGLGAASVVEAVGTPAAWATAVDVVRDGGAIGSVGVPHTMPTIDLMPLFLRNVGVRGGLCPVRAYLPDLMARVLDGSLDPGPVFDTTMPLERTPEAYAAMDERRSIKVALVP